MPQSYTCLHYHIIFSTKRRLPLITADLRQRLYDYIGGIIQHEKGRLLSAGGANDHVHLLLTLRAQTAVSDMLRLLKANSSKWVHETFPDKGGFGWQDGYGAFSVSFSSVERVRRYISEQEQHHRRLSFQAEFMEFLKWHGVEYDERYIWS